MTTLLSYYYHDNTTDYGYLGNTTGMTTVNANVTISNTKRASVAMTTLP